MKLDISDPLLRRNLSRLEARFRARYYSSVQKDVKRRKQGKCSHKTTLRSIEENRQRLEEVKELRAALFRNAMTDDPEEGIRESIESLEMLKSVKVLG